MGLFVPFPQGIQTELVFRLGGRILSNRQWIWVVNNDPTTGDLQFVGDQLRDLAVSDLMPFLSQDIRLLTVRAYDATVPYPGPQTVSSAGVNGGIAEKSHSANVAAKFSFKSSVGPGQWLGWNFVAGIPDSAVALNALEPSWVANVREFYISLIDLYSRFEYQWSVSRAVLNGTPLTTRLHWDVALVRQRTGLVSQRRTRLDNPP